ncbi:hypothetical protein [Loktanella sp. IMCC34160]|uniref:hypothetical protein n=1 Tax=Loktanella sp. IMCC34160 TaxID=2510646 RepID=UPI0013E9F7D4|nr:hypothetical protein [Loktanella sp. IMCC34160]
MARASPARGMAMHRADGVLYRGIPKKIRGLNFPNQIASPPERAGDARAAFGLVSALCD